MWWSPSNKTKLDFYSKLKYKSTMNEERINQLDTMDEVAFRELKDENRKLKKRVQEAEGELTIIKGIGNNSPEMRELQARVKQLDESLANALEINESHQRYNGKLQVRIAELVNDNRLLAKQISDHIKNHEDKFRKAGL